MLTCLQCYATENRTLEQCYEISYKNLRCSFKYNDDDDVQLIIHMYDDESSIFFETQSEIVP